MKIKLCFLAVLLLVSCSERENIKNHVFTDEIRLKTTPVKQQGSSSLCWIYAMLATIETEHLMRGDSVNLSAVALFRQFQLPSQRGMAPMTLELLRRYGAYFHEYEALTSFTHHPFGEQFVLEVPDNYFGCMFLNVPLDTLMARIDRALLAGHPVCWEGDTSESGFSFADGVAEILGRREIDKQEDKTLQTLRQRAFERFQTTDDHTMALVGIARDEDGRRYYIAKNSWGTDNPYGGFMYLSEDYVRLKTICIVLPRNF